MDDVNVLVVFYSRGGLTERLAVLLAEGAIQAGARIRLRRSRDLMPEELIQKNGAWLAERDRMEKEFAAPRLDDVAWADVIAFGTPAGLNGLSAELAATLGAIETMDSSGLAGKLATAFTSSYAPRAGAELALSELQSRLLRLGIITVPTLKASDLGWLESTADYELARAHGRRITAIGRALKTIQTSEPEAE